MSEHVRTPGRTDLHFCPACGRDLVYPVEWGPVSATHYQVHLRCPNCEWTATGRFGLVALDRFDEELDRATAIIERDLERLERANLEDDLERFAGALRAGAILPEDF
jgi:hypothetical protein